MSDPTLFHDILPLAAGRHTIHNWEYADAAARTAATGFVPSDLYKIAFQLDDFTFWILTDDSPPTWESFSANDAHIESIVETYLIDEDSFASNLDTKVPTQQSTKAYVDAQIAGAGTYTDEQAQDAVAAALLASSSIDFVYTDATPSIVFSIKDEYLMDWIAALLNDSTTIDFTYNDGANTFTVDVKTEGIQDIVGAMFGNTTTIAFTYDDAGNAISAAVVTEGIQDIIGGLVADSASIDVTYDDAGNAESMIVILEWLQDTVAAMITGGALTNITATYQDATGLIDFAVAASGATNLDGLSDVVITSAAGGDALRHNGTNFVNSATYTKIQFTIDGGGVAITTGIKLDIEIPFNGTYDQWRLLADVSGSIVLDLWEDSYANYPPTIADAITNSHKPTITTDVKSEDTTLTDWGSGSGKTATAGDILRVNVDSCTSITRCTVIIWIKRTGA